MALAGLLADDHLLGSPIRPKINPDRPFSARKTHFPPRAKQALVIYCTGAVSHADTWEHKPELFRRHDTPMPGAVNTFQGENGNLIQSSSGTSRPGGSCGKMTSDLLPELGSLADDFAFIHSLTSKTNTHGPGETFVSTGFILEGFPSMGSWASYALGTENENLPRLRFGFPTREATRRLRSTTGPTPFCPPSFKARPSAPPRKSGTCFPGKSFPGKTDLDGRRLLRRLNERHLELYLRRLRVSRPHCRLRVGRPHADVHPRGHRPLQGTRIHTQSLTEPTIPKTSTEPASPVTVSSPGGFLEKGVRFVQLFNGSYAMGEGVGNWDGHKKIEAQYPGHAHILDQPAAALIRDLKGRGYRTTPWWSGAPSSGACPPSRREPAVGTTTPSALPARLAGAGVHAPFTYGATDEFGWKAEKDALSLHDFHATILHLVLGLDHERLSYYHNGIERRLTDAARSSSSRKSSP